MNHVVQNYSIYNFLNVSFLPNPDEIIKLHEQFRLINFRLFEVTQMKICVCKAAFPNLSVRSTFLILQQF